MWTFCHLSYGALGRMGGGFLDFDIRMLGGDLSVTGGEPASRIIYGVIRYKFGKLTPST